ncbi:MAG: hypothetical protein V1708_02445 [Candidatus Micrarchaeota archaeon]
MAVFENPAGPHVRVAQILNTSFAESRRPETHLRACMQGIRTAVYLRPREGLTLEGIRRLLGKENEVEHIVRKLTWPNMDDAMVVSRFRVFERALDLVETSAGSQKIRQRIPSSGVWRPQSGMELRVDPSKEFGNVRKYPPKRF